QRRCVMTSVNRTGERGGRAKTLSAAARPQFTSTSLRHMPYSQSRRIEMSSKIEYRPRSDIRKDFISILLLFLTVGLMLIAVSGFAYTVFGHRFVEWSSSRLSDLYLSTTAWQSSIISMSVIVAIVMLEIMV